MFDLLNRARVDAGVDPLAWSTALAEVAAGHGFEMYEEGYFSHVSPATGTVADRMAKVGILYRVVGENLALSPTAESVHDGLMASLGHRENMLDERFTRVGISAVEGPLGLMVVQVFRDEGHGGGDEVGVRRVVRALRTGKADRARGGRRHGHR